jgi:glyoxylase-like metal-dependent hydrolase (beta-lactamase superfamily II)
MKNNSLHFSLIVLCVLALSAAPRAYGAAPKAGAGPAAAPIAVATYAVDEEQLRAVRALARSLRERGGAFAGAPIYVSVPDPASLPVSRLQGLGVEILPLEIDASILSYPLAVKAFAAARAEEKARLAAGALAWLDPGVVVLGQPDALALDNGADAVLRPVTLANTIGLAPGKEPDEYWRPIYAATGLLGRTLPALETIVDRAPIQPYYNCEVFAFNPRLGLAGEWARLLSRFLQDEAYQKTACTTFLRRLFLHQAVLSAVITSRVAPGRIRALPLAGGYPFGQHAQLPEARRLASLDEASVVIFDQAWASDPAWMGRIAVHEPLRGWLAGAFLEYMKLAEGLYRMEGSCNSYLVRTDEGCLLIDPAGAAQAPEFFTSVLERFPLRAILLTHAHADHADGIAAWRRGRDIPVVAQREFVRQREYADELAGFFARRNAIWERRPAAAVAASAPAQERPNTYFDEEYELGLGPLHVRMVHTPGETPDQATILIPELGAVFCGDNYYEYFINNSTFRGTLPRPVKGYLRALDLALAAAPELFLPGHGAPLVGRASVQRTAGGFRDALRRLHDEAVRGINEGKDAYDLMREARLPADIPQVFGKAEWTARGIWQEYVGWFDENPASMYAQPPSSIHPDLVRLAGAGAIVRRAEECLERGENVSVLHLTDVVLNAEPANRQAHEARLKALRALKAGTRNYIERIWLDHGIRLAEEALKGGAR